MSKRGWWWGRVLKKFLDKISLNYDDLFSRSLRRLQCYTSLYKSLSCSARVGFNGNCILSTYRTQKMHSMTLVYFGFRIIFWTASGLSGFAHHRFTYSSPHLFLRTSHTFALTEKHSKGPAQAPFDLKGFCLLLHFAHTLRPIIAQKSQLSSRARTIIGSISRNNNLFTKNSKFQLQRVSNTFKTFPAILK